MHSSNSNIKTFYNKENQRKKDLSRKNSYKLVKDFVIYDKKMHPFALICPGGAYSNVCAYEEGYPYAKKLNERGISAFILYYRVREKALYPNPQNDLKRALKYILRNSKKFNLETKNFSLWGSSAGAHLVASYSTKNAGYYFLNGPKPQKIVLSYPVISMGKFTHQETKNNLLGKNPSDKMIYNLSVENQISEDFPKTFLWCGDSDTLVSPENTKLLDKMLTKFNVKHECHIYKGIEHGVGLAENTCAQEWFDKAVDFLLSD